MIKRNKRALAGLSIAKCRRIRPTDELGPIAMHNLGKGSEQWVRDVIQERWICVKIGQSLCLKLETLATEVAVYKVEHGTLSGIGGVYGRKSSKDILGA